MERMVAELSEDEREAFRAFEAADPVGEVDPLANNPWERRQLAHRVSPMILEDWGCVLVEACRGLSVLVGAWGFAVPPVTQMLAGGQVTMPKSDNPTYVFAHSKCSRSLCVFLRSLKDAAAQSPTSTRRRRGSGVT